MQLSIILVIFYLFIGLDHAINKEMDGEDHCDFITRKMAFYNKRITTDNTLSGLCSIWVSQECEVRAGPKYIIRKYSFFKNNTFLLLQFHYADESCSIATYNVVARGTIQILSPSTIIPGATKTNVRLNSVYLIPFNRQIAHKFSRKMNTSCDNTDARWRPYTAHPIYNLPVASLTNATTLMRGLNSNSLQSRASRSRKQHSLDCLEIFNVEFDELKLLRIEITNPGSSKNSFKLHTVNENRADERIELFFGGLARNIRSQRLDERSDYLQATPLIRFDTLADCPICRNVFRATELSPPLFHQSPSLPAVIDGLWLSIKCESIDGGFWIRRFFRIYSNRNRWFARWTYYSDSLCLSLSHSVVATGTYVQRAIGRLRNDEENSRLESNGKLSQDIGESYVKGGTGNIWKRKHELDGQKLSFLIKKNVIPPSGITVLELSALESFCIPFRKGITHVRRNDGYSRLRNCLPRSIKAPTVLVFKAKINIDWNGDYRLLLASWKDDLWEAPLQRCSISISQSHTKKSSREYLFPLQKYNQYNGLNQHRRYWFCSSSNSCYTICSSFANLITILALFWLRYLF